MVAITGQVPRPPSAPTPSRRPTSAASRCRSPSTTTWSPTRRGHPAGDRRGVPHRRHRPPRAGARRHLQGRAAGADDLHLARRASTCPATGRRPGRTPSRSARPPASCSSRASPVLYVGGGVIRAGASAELRAAGRAHRHPGRHHPDGPRRLPRQPPAAPRHARHARHRGRGRRAAEGRPAHRARRPLRRPGHRQAVDVRARRQGHPRRHRPRRDRQEPPGRRADRRRCQGGHRRADRCRPGRARRRAARRLRRLVAELDRWRETYPLGYELARDGTLAPQYVIERLGQIAGPDAIYAAGVGQHQMWAAQFIKYEKPGHLAELRRPRHHGLRGAGRHGRQGRRARTRPCGPSTATAASR